MVGATILIQHGRVRGPNRRVKGSTHWVAMPTHGPGFAYPSPAMDGKLTYAAHVPEGDGPFPSVILLHGWGANAHDLLGFAPFLHGGNALVLCPQGPFSLPIGYGMRGYG